MEAEARGPDADHAPGVKNDDGGHDGREHGFGAKVESALEPPEGVDSRGLGGDADEEEVGEGQGVVGHDAVLEGGDDGDGGVEGVAQEEVADEVEETLFQVPDLRDGAMELPDAGRDDVHAGRDRFAGPSLLDDEPWDGEQEPDARGECDQDAETPVVVGFTCSDVDSEEDADDDGEDDDFAARLDVEGHVRKPTSLHHVGVIVVVPGDDAVVVFLGFRPELWGVSCEPRKGGGPEGERGLVRNHCKDTCKLEGATTWINSLVMSKFNRNWVARLSVLRCGFRRVGCVGPYWQAALPPTRGCVLMGAMAGHSVGAVLDTFDVGWPTLRMGFNTPRLLPTLYIEKGLLYSSSPRMAIAMEDGCSGATE